MDEIKVLDVTYQTIDDLCLICVPPEKRGDPSFKKGIEQKRIWAMGMWHEWGPFAKIAYEGSTPAGQIQYRPLPAHRLIYIYCIYIPEKQHWQKGIATRLLDSLIEDVKKPQVWFDRQPALALVTKTFPGEKPGRSSAAPSPPQAPGEAVSHSERCCRQVCRRERRIGGKGRTPQRSEPARLSRPRVAERRPPPGKARGR